MTWQAGEVISLLRWQRHDILNHLQVISGYIQLKKGERALRYLEQVVGELERLGTVLRLKQPELALLILKKMEELTNRGINLRCDIHTMMENLDLEKDAALALWESAWDLAMALAGDGGTLNVSLMEVADGYCLSFKFGGEAVLPEGDAARLAELAGHHQIPFVWEPARGEMSLLFKKRLS
ncbi:MAG: Spo0B domain-containing protein [Moorella sp. (in: firmicutes)]